MDLLKLKLTAYNVGLAASVLRNYRFQTYRNQNITKHRVILSILLFHSTSQKGLYFELQNRITC